MKGIEKERVPRIIAFLRDPKNEDAIRRAEAELYRTLDDREIVEHVHYEMNSLVAMLSTGQTPEVTSLGVTALLQIYEMATKGSPNRLSRELAVELLSIEKSMRDFGVKSCQ